MTHEWTSTFNTFPSGTQFGSVTGRAIRETKEAFYERLVVEHDITEGETPIVTHAPGETSIVQFGTTAEELQHAIPQTLFYDYESQTFYAYDLDANQRTVGASSHAALSGLSADDHPQYAKNLGEVTGSLTLNGFVNLGSGAGSSGALLSADGHTIADHTPIDDQTAMAPLTRIDLTALTTTATPTTTSETYSGLGGPSTVYASYAEYAYTGSGTLLGGYCRYSDGSNIVIVQAILKDATTLRFAAAGSISSVEFNALVYGHVA